jgi:hypothetical protein
MNCVWFYSSRENGKHVACHGFFVSRVFPVTGFSGFLVFEYRLGVGDYRVRFHQEGETIRILRVRNRREAYR